MGQLLLIFKLKNSVYISKLFHCGFLVGSTIAHQFNFHDYGRLMRFTIRTRNSDR